MGLTSAPPRPTFGPDPGHHRQGVGATPSAGTQPHGHVCHLLRGPLLLPLGPRHPRRHVWAVPAGPPGAGRSAEGPGPAVGRPGGAEPRDAGPPQRDRRGVRLRDGLLPVQPGGGAVALASDPAGAAGTSSLTPGPVRSPCTPLGL